MKKRLLSLLMALCLMLTLAPAAFATDADDIPDIPNSTSVVSDVLSADELTEESGIAPLDDSDYVVTGVPGLGTSSSPYLISTAEQLVAVADTQFGTLSLRAAYVLLVDDIDFSEVTISDGYVIQYFYGLIAGCRDNDRTAWDPITISGLPADSHLLYAWFGGYIQNFNLNLGGQASSLIYMPGSVGGSYLDRTVSSITVTSTVMSTSGQEENAVVTLTSDGYANYSPFQFTVVGNYTMENCTNEADISSTTYGGVFCGYYPLDTNGKYTFSNCVNKGTVLMRHVGMIFGNNSGMGNYTYDADNPENNQFVFTNCKNEGTILGTASEAKMFSSQAGGSFNAICSYYEGLLTTGTNGNFNGGTLGTLTPPAGMALTAANDGTLTITPATDADVAYYIVSVYSYINIFVNGDTFYGNLRFGATQRIDASALSGEDNPVTVKKYGICDYGRETAGLELTNEVIAMDSTHEESEYIFVVTYGGNSYYWLEHDAELMSLEGNYTYYVNRSRVEGVKNAPDIVTLAAYNSDNELLGIVSI